MLKKILITICLSITILSTGSMLSHAYEIDPSYRPINSPFNLEYKQRDAQTNTILILQILTGALLYFAAPLAVIFIIIGGWSMIVGGADTEKVEQAKKSLTWSAVGLVLIILSYSAVRYILIFIVKAAENTT